MAGRGMGAATKGGGCVSSGARNKMTSKPSSKVAVMMKDGGMAKKKFPDLTGDGKVTKKDILKGRGVKMKKGGDVSMPMAKGIAMAMEAGKKLVSKKAKKKVEKKDVAKKMGGGMVKKYRKGGYAGCK